MGYRAGNEKDNLLMARLLKDYSRPVLSEEDRSALISRLEKAEAGGGTIVPFPFPVYRAAAAAAAVIILLSSVLFFYTAPLENVYSVAGTEGPTYTEKRGSYTAPPGGELEIRSGTEKIVLSPGTTLKVSGKPLRRISGSEVNIYRLVEGDVYIEHSGGSFVLETDYGSFSPAGTVISCSSSADSLELFCIEGRMEIDPKDGDSFFLDSGMKLIGRRTAAGWQADIIPAEDTGSFFIPGNTDIDSNLPDEKALEKEEASASVQAKPEPEKPEAEEPPGWVPEWTTSFGELGDVYVSDGLIYLTGESRVAAADFKTGRAVSDWQPRQEYRFTGFAGGMLLGLGGKSLEALNLLTGEPVWTIEELPAVYKGFAASGDSLFLPSADGNLYTYSLKDGNRVSVEQMGAGLYGVPALSESLVAVSSIDKRITALRISDMQPQWIVETEERLMGDLPVFSTGGETLLYFTGGGRLVLLGSEDGRLLAETKYQPPMIRPPEAAGEYFIFRDGAGIGIADSGSLELRMHYDQVLYDAGMAGGKAVYITESGIYPAEGGEPFSVELGSGAVSWSAVMTGLPDGTIEKRVYR